MKELGRKVGEMTYDGLITDVAPDVVVCGVVLAAPESETTLKRGTLLTAGENGFAAAAAEDFAVNGTCAILCDDVTYSAAAPVTAYVAGCFNPARVWMDNGESLTENEIDTLAFAAQGLYFKAAVGV